MQSILVATDFSMRAEPAIFRGAALAKAQNARLTLAHIVDDDQSERLAAAAEAEARSLFNDLYASLLRDYGVEPSIIVHRGEPHADILTQAEKVEAELIIVGSHRRNLLRNTFVGTTAERCLRASPIPVLVVRTPGESPYQRPVIALDLNEHDLSPLGGEAALGIVDTQAVNIVFAYDVRDYPLLRQAGATDEELRKYLDGVEEAVRPTARSILAGAAAKPADIILKPAVFNAYEPVLEAASELGADLIILGTKRKQAFDRFRLGSVSEAVLRRAEVDVLVVPPGARS